MTTPRAAAGHQQTQDGAAPATPAHAPTARVRCSGGKTLVIVDSVAGMTRAAPTRATPGEDQRRGAADCHGRQRGPTEDHETGDQGPAAAVAVTDCAPRSSSEANTNA